jgi:hypothetical protein
VQSSSVPTTARDKKWQQSKSLVIIFLFDDTCKFILVTAWK